MAAEQGVRWSGRLQAVIARGSIGEHCCSASIRARRNRVAVIGGQGVRCLWGCCPGSSRGLSQNVVCSRFGVESIHGARTDSRAQLLQGSLVPDQLPDLPGVGHLLRVYLWKQDLSRSRRTGRDPRLSERQENSAPVSHQPSDGRGPGTADVPLLPLFCRSDTLPIPCPAMLSALRSEGAPAQ